MRKIHGLAAMVALLGAAAPARGRAESFPVNTDGALSCTVTGGKCLEQRNVKVGGKSVPVDTINIFYHETALLPGDVQPAIGYSYSFVRGPNAARCEEWIPKIHDREVANLHTTKFEDFPYLHILIKAPGMLKADDGTRYYLDENVRCSETRDLSAILF